MEKIIRATPMCMMPFNVIFAILLIVCWVNIAAHGFYWEFLKVSSFLASVYGTLYVLFTTHRISVTENGFTLTSFLATPRRIDFSEIVESRLSNSPWLNRSLCIYTKTFDSRAEPALSIPLILFREHEIGWLIILPELRFQGQGR